jgi:hypothetical protein
MDDVDKIKFLTPVGLELRPIGRSHPVDSRYTDCAIPAHIRHQRDQMKDDETRSVHEDDVCIKMCGVETTGKSRNLEGG